MDTCHNGSSYSRMKCAASFHVLSVNLSIIGTCMSAQQGFSGQKMKTNLCEKPGVCPQVKNLKEPSKS